MLDQIAMAHRDLEVGDRDPGVFARDRLGSSALPALDRIDQVGVLAVGDDQDVAGGRDLSLAAARTRSGRRTEAR